MLLWLSPLLVPLGLVIATCFHSPPVFKAPQGATVLVSQPNPFVNYSGPAYFERLSSPLPPRQFWKQMEGVLNTRGVRAGADMELANGNYLDVREHRQASFRVLGAPPIRLYSPVYHCHGGIKGAPMQIFLGADGHGGSILEIWVMEKS